MLCDLLCEELVGGQAHDLAVAHDHEVAIISARALDKAALGKKDTCVDTFLKFLYLKLTHNSKSFGRLTGRQSLLFRSLSRKQSFLRPLRWSCRR